MFMRKNFQSTAEYAVKSIVILALTVAAFFLMPACTAYADAEESASPFLWEDAITVYVGKTKDNIVFNASIKSIKSADTSIATVKKSAWDEFDTHFEVTGKKAGKTTIVVKTNTNATLKCKITVKSKSKSNSNSNTESGQTRTKNYMKNLNGISWDLKTNGTTSYQTKFAGIGMHTQKAKISKWKVRTTATDAKILTFRLTFDPHWKLTNSQIHKIANSSWRRSTGSIGGGCGFRIIDYDTGENLEASGNSCGVEVSDNGWHKLKTKYYADNDGCCVTLVSAYIDITVTYYPGTVLAIGVTGSTSLGNTSGNTNFQNGKAPFGKTSYYSKTNKKIAHFKRVK